MKNGAQHRALHGVLWLLIACCSCGVDKRPITQIGVNDIRVTVVGEQATNLVWSGDYVGGHVRFRYEVGQRRITFIERQLFVDDRGYGRLDWNARVMVDGDRGTVFIKRRIAPGNPLVSNEVYWLTAPGVSNFTFSRWDRPVAR